MNRPIRIGVLGAGMISTCGWGVLPNLGPISNRVQITAITSPTREKRENVARQYDIPRTFASLDEMLAGGRHRRSPEPHADSETRLDL